MAADDEGELNAIADELYALRPDAFAAARDEQVRKARAEKQATLARALSQLRRPTQSAWLINLLWRNQRELMEQLLQLAQDLSQAQAHASGPELHRLTALRRQLEAALVRGARSLAETAGVSVTASMEREAQETLAAALARTDVADEIRTGRLVKPASYAGFGTLLPAMPPTTGRQGARTDDAARGDTAPQDARDNREPTPIGAARAPKRDAHDEVAVERASARHAQAEQRVADARAALDVAADILATHGRAAEAALEQHQAVRSQLGKLQAQLIELQDQLREIQKQAATAEQSAEATARRRDQAEKAHALAVRTLARAEQQLKDATDG